MNIEILFDLVSHNVTVAEFRAEIQRQIKEDEKIKEKQEREEKNRRLRRRTAREDTARGNPEANRDAKADAAKVEEDSVNFLNRKNPKGDTLLHVAVTNGSFELVEELIGLGINLDAKDGSGKTAFNLLEGKSSQEDLKKAALLKTRGDWAYFAREFNANRVIHMLMEAEPEIINARGIPKLLFIGSAGCGKSTYMNARFGVEYERVLTGGYKPGAVEKNNGVKPVALVGHGATTTTLYPYARTLPGNLFAHVDLPGLFDNRDYEHKIVSASSTQWITSMPGDIQGILVFLDISALEMRSSSGVRETAEALYRIIQGKEELLNSVRYVITKVMDYNIESGLTPQSLIDERLINILERSKTQGDNSSEFMLKDMVVNPNKIFLNDLSKKSIDKIDDEFKGLLPTPASVFNFNLHYNEQEIFKDLLNNFITKYLQNKNRINYLSVENKEHDDQLQDEKAALELELAVNRKLFETISTIIQDLGIKELNTQEFLDEVAKDAKRPSLSVGTGSKKRVVKPFVPQSSVPKAAFYREAPVDRHWYEDHEVEALLQNYFGKDATVNVFAALDAHHLEGETLQENLQAWLAQPENAGVKHVVMPVNLGNRHWVALYINVENRQSPSIAAYIDPFGHEMPQDLKNALKVVFPEIQDKNVFTSPIQLQDDGYNCGPWIVEILKLLVYKGALPDESYDIQAARQSHQQILQRQPEAVARAEM